MLRRMSLDSILFYLFCISVVLYLAFAAYVVLVVPIMEDIARSKKK